MPRRALSRNEASKIRKLYMEGWTYNQLTSAYGVSRNIISKIIFNRGTYYDPNYRVPNILSRKKRRRKLWKTKPDPLDDEQKDKILALRSEGNSFTKIAQVVGVSDHRVKKYLESIE